MDKTISKYLIIGTPLISAFLWTSGTTDPVNATKLFILGGIAGAVGLVLMVFCRADYWKNSRTLVLLVLFYFLAMLNALFFGVAPFLQNFYGEYGRQTGFLTYFFLLVLFLAATLIQDKDVHRFFIFGIFVVGVLNIAYCSWVILFGDFLPWNNIYRKILGLFGNPDFISAYLGIFIVACFAYLFSTAVKNMFKLGLILLSLIALWQILHSHAIQGLVVMIGGMVLVGFYLVRSLDKSKYLQMAYILGSAIFGFIAIMGTLQKGPLSFVYKKSVSLRGSYWRAGINMGIEHPFNGVGFDGYGDFYRQARPPVALIDMPGVQVVTNVAHNVFIDFFATGGWPLLISYALLFSFVTFRIIKFTICNKKFNPVFVTLSVTWVCYVVQSIISINQIGLAVWGWVLGGAIISYTNFPLENDSTNTGKASSKKQVSTGIISPKLVAGIGFVIGLIIAYPPLGSDARWKSALDSRNLNNIENSLDNSFLNPVPSSRFSIAYQLFANSNLPDKALKYARLVTKSNPNYFDGWRALYLLPSSSAEEKVLAEKNLRRLDPKNPNVLSAS